MEIETLDLHSNTILARNSSYQVRRMVIEERKSVPPHYHTDCTDIILPLSGEARLVLGSGVEEKLDATRLYTVPANETLDLLSIVNDSVANPFVYR